MLNQFKVGDVVVCVDPPDANRSHNIVGGGRYTVLRAYSEFVVLDGTGGGNWMCTRFRPAPDLMDDGIYEEAMAGQAIYRDLERG